jgi:hypothetical protein
MEFQVNGIAYKEKEKKQVSSTYNRKLMTQVVALAMLDPYAQPIKQKTVDCDIIKEYELIQNKQSSLSKSERECVIKTFESKYIRV